MNASNLAKHGYATNAMVTQSARRSEYEIIAKITHQLRASAITSNTDYPSYVKALHENRKLWKTLALDVAHPDNKLPQELRARVFYLAEFTMNYTSKILGEKASIMPLLEINMAILRGLKPEGAKS